MKTRVAVASSVLALVAFLVIGSIGFVGCSSTVPSQSAAPGVYNAVTIVDGSMGSSTQQMLVAMTRVLNKYYPEIAWGVRTGVPADSVVRLAEGTIPMAISGPQTYITAYGEGKEAQSKLRAVAMLTRATEIMLVVKDAPFDNMRDLPKGYTLCDAPGTADVPATELYLKAFGMKTTDFNYRQLGRSAAAEAWRNGNLQGMTLGGGMPSPVLTELGTTKQGYKVLKATEAELKPIADQARSKGYTVKELTLVDDAPLQFTYNTWGLEVPFFVSVRDDFPADITYKMVKVFDEHLDELVAGSVLCKNVTPAILLKFSGGAFPLHPGVDKYFREKGYLK